VEFGLSSPDLRPERFSALPKPDGTYTILLPRHKGFIALATAKYFLLEKNIRAPQVETKPIRMTPTEKDELAVRLDTTTFNEVQLLLAEKRTALSTLRTGIAVFAFPLSVLSVLIATSKSYELHAVIHWLVPLLLLNLGLVVLGVFLIHTAVRRIRRYDRLLDGLKRKNSRLAELLD